MNMTKFSVQWYIVTSQMVSRATSFPVGKRQVNKAHIGRKGERVRGLVGEILTTFVGVIGFWVVAVALVPTVCRCQHGQRRCGAHQSDVPVVWLAEPGTTSRNGTIHRVGTVTLAAAWRSTSQEKNVQYAYVRHTWLYFTEVWYRLNYPVSFRVLYWHGDSQFKFDIFCCVFFF